MHPSEISTVSPSYEFVVLVVPIDSAAPKGRLILPQQQTINYRPNRQQLHCLAYWVSGCTTCVRYNRRSEAENELIQIFEEKKIKYLIVYNKCDLLSDEKRLELEKEGTTQLSFITGH